MIPLDHLLDLLPSKLLDRLAVRFRVNKVNHVKLPGQTVFLCLLNVLVNHPLVSQRLLKATYEKVTGRPVDHSSFSKRLAAINPDYFEGLYEHVSQQIQPLMAAGDARGLRLRRVDATTVVLSAKVLACGIHVASSGKSQATYDKRHLADLLNTGLCSPGIDALDRDPSQQQGRAPFTSPASRPPRRQCLPRWPDWCT